ncbi:MAG: type II toxin-antitoxin system YafQ family toxin [Armatimonadota bacterium]
MRRLVWTNTFVRAYKRFSRRHPQLLEKLQRVLEQLSVDPFQTQLRTHKLRGELEGVWACWIERDIRLLFEFVTAEDGGEEILLLTLGSHDEVY